MVQQENAVELNKQAAAVLPSNGIDAELDQMSKTALDPDVLRERALRVRVEGSKFYAKPQREEESLDEFEARRTEAVIGQIPYLAAMEKRAGRNFAMVIGITPGDFIPPEGMQEVRGYLEAEWLSGAASKVYEHCAQAGLSPTIEYWDDIRYYWAGHVVVARFPGDSTMLSREELVKSVTKQIPLRAAFAAECGRTWAEVMSIRADRDFNALGQKLIDLPQFSKIVWQAPEKFLGGAALEVFKHCKEKGLEPDLQYWEGTDGNTGYSILMHWPRVKVAPPPVEVELPSQLA